MPLVLDSNEYIGALGAPTHPHSLHLIEYLISSGGRVRIVRSIVHEVARNIPPEDQRRFHRLLKEFGVEISEDWEVPFEMVERYRRNGLKTGDAFIAAFTEWVGADTLVTENRDFLTLQPGLPFDVLKAEQFMSKFGIGMGVKRTR